jgi:hypothetical protein
MRGFALLPEKRLMIITNVKNPRRPRPSYLMKSLKRSILLSRDLLNYFRFGLTAPRYAELIWVNPHQIFFCIESRSKLIASVCSGYITNISEYFTLENFRDTYQYRSCLSHWVDHLPWEKTTDYSMMLKGIESGKFWVGCKTEQELLYRYQKLDDIFLQVKRARRFKTSKELDPKAFREEGGIIISIGERGEPLIFDGYHRLSIALIQNLSLIPAQLGAVDTRALDNLEKYRLPPSSQLLG